MRAYKYQGYQYQYDETRETWQIFDEDEQWVSCTRFAVPEVVQMCAAAYRPELDGEVTAA